MVSLLSGLELNEKEVCGGKAQKIFFFFVFSILKAFGRKSKEGVFWWVVLEILTNVLFPFWNFNFADGGKDEYVCLF